MKKKELSRLLANLETQNYFLRRVLVALMDTVNPPPCVYDFSLYVVRNGLTADEVERLKLFSKLVIRHWEMLPLTKEWLVDTFDDVMTPRLKGKIEDVLRAHQKDRFLKPACDIILGPDPTWNAEGEGEGDLDQGDEKEQEGGAAPLGSA